ncbi:MAG TPA: hypothetical protein VH592_09225 [Gemmataceae bacterium]|jgi:hypothetical protein
MTLVRYGQAAMIAAIMVLSGNAVWAQQQCPKKDDGIYYRISDLLSSIPCEIKVKYCVTKDCCATGACCKDGKCGKEAECCSSYKPYEKCDAKCSCAKDNKCACCKDGECCCDKNGKCSCSKDKTSTAKTECDCPFLNKLAKKTAIIMVMPASMPLPPCCMEAMGIMPHPPMPMPPPGPQAFLPPPMPPMPPFPPTPSMGLPPYVSPMQVECPPPAPMYYGNAIYAAAPATVCSAPASSSKMEIIAPPSCDQLEMSIGEDNAIRCKKMLVKIGDKVMSVSRFDDRVRIRGDELKATADCVRTEGKSRLILEGNVTMHCKKDGHTVANVMTGEHIEMNLSSGAVTIKSSGKVSSPAVHIERVDKEDK